MSHSVNRAPHSIGVLLLAALVLGVPMLASVAALLSGARDDAGAISRALADGQVWASLAFSCWYAAAGTLLALAGALAVALVLDGRAPLDRLARASAVLPLPIPPLAAALALLLLLGQSGWLARLATQTGLIAASPEFPALVVDPRGVGLILAIAWKELPFLTLVATSLVALRGPRLREAAQTLGASPAAVQRRVLLPMLMRGLAPSALAVFVFVIGSLELPLVLGPSRPMALALLMQERRQSLEPALRAEGYAIALLGLGVALLMVAAHEWLRARDAE
jgi:putative spermidine/putrescine transport system permease protein